MNLVELDHALRKLRLSGMADTLEPRLRQAQTEKMVPLDIGAPSYRFVRRYLERRPPVPVTLRQVDPLIRQLTLYRALIDQKTGDPT